MLGLGTLVPLRTAWATTTAGGDFRGSVIVSLFLRGAADGLSIVPPIGDGRYYDLRPSLALQPPGSGPDAALELDGFFGLHPALAGLIPFFNNHSLAIVHAVGNPSDSHSHFSAQDFMEGGREDQGSDNTGWLGRHVAGLDSGNDSAFRVLATGPSVQKSLNGVVPAFAISDAENFGLNLKNTDPQRVRETMLELYSWPDEPLDVTTRQTFAAMDILGDLEIPEDPGYPKSALGLSMRTLAIMIKGGLGVEVAGVDSGGWDHHDNLATQIEGRLTDLGDSLSTFVEDLGEEMGRVTIVVMTEFGRRAAENASLGADHGHGSVMFALGAGVRGGKVYTEWPGLESQNLYGPGDLGVTTDYRLVLGELLARRAEHTDLDSVFPGYEIPPYLGIFNRPRARKPDTRRD